jgi:hypothetical protein
LTATAGDRAHISDKFLILCEVLLKLLSKAMSQLTIKSGHYSTVTDIRNKREKSIRDIVQGENKQIINKQGACLENFNAVE